MADQIYSIITQFNKSSWKTFARTKLKLSDFDIEEAVQNNQDDIKEQRYQMVRRWMRIGGRKNTIEELKWLHNVENQVSEAQTNSSMPPEHREESSSPELEGQPSVSCKPTDAISQNVTGKTQPLVDRNVSCKPTAAISPNVKGKTQPPVEIPVHNKKKESFVVNKAFGSLPESMKASPVPEGS